LQDETPDTGFLMLDTGFWTLGGINRSPDAKDGNLKNQLRAKERSWLLWGFVIAIFPRVMNKDFEFLLDIIERCSIFLALPLK
jgi:hypothetical protein